MVPFAEATRALPPWLMGRTLKRDEAGAALPVEAQGIDDRTLACEWDELGACACHRELRFANDVCPQFAPRVMS
jgi:hypothetical protein